MTGSIGGKIRVAKAANESDIASYAIYYGSSATMKLTLATIATVPAIGVDPVVPVPYGTPLPPGATHILVFSANAVGENPMPVATPLHDATVHWVPLIVANHTGIDTETRTPQVLLDASSQKLRVVGRGSLSYPIVLDADLDGSNPVLHNDVAGPPGSVQADDEAWSTSGVVDATNQKLLIVTDCSNYGVTPNRLNVSELFRCNLDGTGCTPIELSAGMAPGSFMTPSVVIDPVNQKLLAVVDDASASGTNVPAVFRCNLDGMSCAYKNLTMSNGAGQTSGLTPSVVIDTANQKLLVATNDGSRSNKPSLFVCNVDGSSYCDYRDVSMGQGPSSGLTPSAVVDAAGQAVLVVTQNGANANKPGLFRCNLDGTSCAYSDISAGRGANSGLTPAAVVDAANQSLVVVADNNEAGSNTIALYRCELDGTGCHYSDISTGRAQSGYTPTVALGPGGEIFVVTQDNYDSSRSISMFYIY